VKSVYYVDADGRAVTDIPQGALVQLLPDAAYENGVSLRHPDAIPTTYMDTSRGAPVFFVSDGVERTEVYFDALSALRAWRIGLVFAEEKRQENEPST